MIIEGEHTFRGPREAVWELVRDPNALASCIPGAHSLEQVNENTYEGRMHVRVGPVSGVFAGSLMVSDEIRPASFTLLVEGRGAPGFVRGTGNVVLSEVDENVTLIRYDGELHIGGKLAGVGQRLLDTVGKSIIRQGLEAMDQQLQARTAPISALASSQGQGAPPAADSIPPGATRSQVDFALSVARDVIKEGAAEVFSAENRTTWLAVTATIIGVVIGFWLGRKCDRH